MQNLFQLIIALLIHVCKRVEKSKTSFQKSVLGMTFCRIANEKRWFPETALHHRALPAQTRSV